MHEYTGLIYFEIIRMCVLLQEYMDTSVSLVLFKRQQNCSIQEERVKGTGGGEGSRG